MDVGGAGAGVGRGGAVAAKLPRAVRGRGAYSTVNATGDWLGDWTGDWSGDWETGEWAGNSS